MQKDAKRIPRRALVRSNHHEGSLLWFLRDQSETKELVAFFQRYPVQLVFQTPTAPNQHVWRAFCMVVRNGIIRSDPTKTIDTILVDGNCFSGVSADQLTDLIRITFHVFAEKKWTIVFMDTGWETDNKTMAEEVARTAAEVTVRGRITKAVDPGAPFPDEVLAMVINMVRGDERTVQETASLLSVGVRNLQVAIKEYAASLPEDTGGSDEGGVSGSSVEQQHVKQQHVKQQQLESTSTPSKAPSGLSESTTQGGGGGGFSPLLWRAPVSVGPNKTLNEPSNSFFRKNILAHDKYLFQWCGVLRWKHFKLPGDFPSDMYACEMKEHGIQTDIRVGGAKKQVECSSDEMQWPKRHCIGGFSVPKDGPPCVRRSLERLVDDSDPYGLDLCPSSEGINLCEKGETVYIAHQEEPPLFVRVLARAAPLGVWSRSLQNVLALGSDILPRAVRNELELAPVAILPNTPSSDISQIERFLSTGVVPILVENGNENLCGALSELCEAFITEVMRAEQNTPGAAAWVTECESNDTHTAWTNPPKGSLKESSSSKGLPQVAKRCGACRRHPSGNAWLLALEHPCVYRFQSEADNRISKEYKAWKSLPDGACTVMEEQAFVWECLKGQSIPWGNSRSVHVVASTLRLDPYFQTARDIQSLFSEECCPSWREFWKTRCVFAFREALSAPSMDDQHIDRTQPVVAMSPTCFSHRWFHEDFIDLNSPEKVRRASEFIKNRVLDDYTSHSIDYSIGNNVRAWGWEILQSVPGMASGGSIRRVASSRDISMETNQVVEFLCGETRWLNTRHAHEFSGAPGWACTPGPSNPLERVVAAFCMRTPRCTEGSARFLGHFLSPSGILYGRPTASKITIQVQLEQKDNAKKGAFRPVGTNQYEFVPTSRHQNNETSTFVFVLGKSDNPLTIRPFESSKVADVWLPFIGQGNGKFGVHGMPPGCRIRRIVLELHNAKGGCLDSRELKPGYEVVPDGMDDKSRCICVDTGSSNNVVHRGIIMIALGIWLSTSQFPSEEPTRCVVRELLFPCQFPDKTATWIRSMLDTRDLPQMTELYASKPKNRKTQFDTWQVWCSNNVLGVPRQGTWSPNTRSASAKAFRFARCGMMRCLDHSTMETRDLTPSDVCPRGSHFVAWDSPETHPCMQVLKAVDKYGSNKGPPNSSAIRGTLSVWVNTVIRKKDSKTWCEQAGFIPSHSLGVGKSCPSFVDYESCLFCPGCLEMAKPPRCSSCGAACSFDALVHTVHKPGVRLATCKYDFEKYLRGACFLASSTGKQRGIYVFTGRQIPNLPENVVTVTKTTQIRSSKDLNMPITDKPVVFIDSSCWGPGRTVDLSLVISNLEAWSRHTKGDAIIMAIPDTFHDTGETLTSKWDRNVARSEYAKHYGPIEQVHVDDLLKMINYMHYKNTGEETLRKARRTCNKEDLEDMFFDVMEEYSSVSGDNPSKYRRFVLSMRNK